MWHYHAAVQAQLYLLSGELDKASAVFAEVHNSGQEPPLITGAVPIYHLILLEVMFAQRFYEDLLTNADEILSEMTTYNVHPFKADVLFLQAQAYLQLGHEQEASVTLTAARQEAESQPSKRILWQILLALAELEETADHDEMSSSWYDDAYHVISGIIEQLSDPMLKGAFLNLPQVQVVLGRYAD